MKKFEPIWYTIPLFQEEEPIQVYHKEQDEQSEAKILEKKNSVKNLHVLARADFSYGGEERALLRITADDQYQLYVNGTFLGQGPRRHIRSIIITMNLI